MNVAACTDIGLVRKVNQDSFFLSQDLNFPLFVIADGMGGHKSGEIASRDAIEVIKNVFLQEYKNFKSKKDVLDTIKESIKQANYFIYEKSFQQTKYNGMGTTVSLAYIYKDFIFIGHVGDSRIYKIKENHIKQLTEDHSMVNELIKEGKITKAQAKIHPQKNIITRAVGTNAAVEVDIESTDYVNNDKLLLCSDGLFNMVEEDDILTILNKKDSLLIRTGKLIDIANRNGGLDNITVLLVEF